MKIATYNLHYGGKTLNHWGKLIQELNCELIFFQETCSPRLHLEANGLEKYLDRSAWGNLKSKELDKKAWDSGLFAKSGDLKRINVPDFEGCSVGFEIRNAKWHSAFFDNIFVFSFHAPSHRTKNYRKETNHFLDNILKITNKGNLIIGGDFNINLVYGKDAMPSPYVRQEKLIIQRLRDEFGLLNAWTEVNAGFEGVDLTYMGVGKKSIGMDPKLVTQIDGIFIPNIMLPNLKYCEVLTGKEWEELSDHFPVVATLDLPA